MKYLVITSIIFISNISSAEPWLSNRYAQNCSACHAPGRVNVPAKERRCTLSCQGCHVNPNGGGLRNLYGKWNEERWLYSLQSKSWNKNKMPPAHYKDQPYNKEKLKEYFAKLDKVEKKEAIKEVLGEGLPMIEADGFISEKDHDRKNASYEKEIEPSRAKFLAQIPKGDPIREKDLQLVKGGGDLRYFYFTETDKNGTSTTRSLLMGSNLGVQISPYKKLSFVGEGSFANGSNNELFQGFTTTAFAKSAYLMVDDLPYNIYVMSGLYRPMFHTHDPDHNSLTNVMSNMGYNATFRTTTIGAAPNVPFINIHLLSPIGGTAGGLNTENAKAGGTVINLGARWVTLGASATLSIWNTKSQVSATNEVTRQMQSLSFGGMYKNWIPTLDIVRIHREDATAIDEATVISLQNKYRFWREFYLMANWGTANSTVGLKEGSAGELSLGVKGFLWAGVEFEALYINRTSQPKSVTSINPEINNKYIQTQLHWFF